MGVYSEKIPVAKQDDIKNFILQKFDAIVSPKQYTFWEIKHKDFVAAFYNSGKFVVQGKNPEVVLEFLASEFDCFGSFKSSGSSKSETSKSNNGNTSLLTLHSSPYIGTDESGKGDFFGPLVVAGVLLDEKNRVIFEKLGIKDSKTLKDDQMLKMALEIQKNSVYSVVVITNAKYNDLYDKFKNLNKLLAWGHARAIENILEKTNCEYALSDKFGDESLIKNALLEKGRKIKLEQRTKAESDLAVAAASVLARATFVKRIKDLESYFGVKLPKGCNNIVKLSAKTFIETYGKERLNEVCKKHFKTYNEV